MVKYLWYSTEVGISDDFDTQEECEADAIENCKEIQAEYGIYSYDDSVVPSSDVSIDDCDYLGFIE